MIASWDANSGISEGGLIERDVILKSNIYWIEMWGSLLESILSSSLAILSAVSLVLNPSKTSGSLDASMKSYVILNPNLWANLIVLSTLSGSSIKVFFGGSGVLTISFFKSSIPFFV